MFRSILIPITATAGFVLSLLATLGSLTGHLPVWLARRALWPYTPRTHHRLPAILLAFGILFGLAMDYQAVPRLRHARSARPRSSRENRSRRGLHAGRAVVAAAAAIMISVFAGFIFSEASTVRLIGFGLSFGVLIDAFVVRLLLIPAAMHLLGKHAWWFPKWLDRIVPNIDVEGAELEREAHTSPAHTGAVEEVARV